MINEAQEQENSKIDFHTACMWQYKWKDIESLLQDPGATFVEGEGSRVGDRLFNERRVFHRPHPSPDTDKGAVNSIRRWLESNGVTP